jgi:hypothetical protein
MPLQGFSEDARRFEEIDQAALAREEARDAVRYYKKRGHWPQLMSERAYTLAFHILAAEMRKKC